MPLVTPLAHQPRSAGDGVEPGREAGVVLKFTNVNESVSKGVLSEILRVAAVTIHSPPKIPQDGGPMALEELAERIRRAGSRCGHEFFLGRW